MSAIVITLAIGHSTGALACKELIPPEHLRASLIDAYSDIVIATVNAVEDKGTGNPVEEMFRRAKPFKARAKIARSLKGPASSGDVVSIETIDNEEAHAVCPLQLEAGQTYLFLLKRQGDVLRISRYVSMTTSMKEPQASTYVRDVELAVAAGASPR